MYTQINLGTELILGWPPRMDAATADNVSCTGCTGQRDEDAVTDKRGQEKHSEARRSSQSHG
eukprot:SAG22_NODE_791_length_7210_cov_40.904936_5_plen_62_part_00